MEATGSGFLSSGPGEVMVRIFPCSDIHVAMRQDSAIQLLRLLERYNWALSEPRKYADRWRNFWRVVTPLERTVVAMFVRSSNGGQFRGLVCLRPLPAEVAGFAGDRTLVKLDVEVAREFAQLHHFFLQTFVSIDDLKFKWHETHRTVMQAHSAAVERVLHSWWCGGGSIDLGDLLRITLIASGFSAEEAKRVANDMGLEAAYLIHAREDALCKGKQTESTAIH